MEDKTQWEISHVKGKRQFYFSIHYQHHDSNAPLYLIIFH